MRASARISDINLTKAISKAGAFEKGVQTVVTIAAREDTKRFVPYVSGALRATVETESVPEKGLLVWGNSDVNYAKAQYYGLPGKTWPGTVNNWFDVAKNTYLPNWILIAQKEVDRIGRT